VRRYEVWTADGSVLRGYVDEGNLHIPSAYPAGHVFTDELRESSYRTLEERVAALEAKFHGKTEQAETMKG
jgi:hypothetical protein